MGVGLNRVKSEVLEGVRDYLDAEVGSCDGGICPEQRPAFEALIRIVERELWRRPKYRREWKKRNASEKRSTEHG